MSADYANNQIKIATANKRLGEAYMAQGQYAAALKEFLDTEKELPDDPFLQYDLGLVYLARKKYALAETRFRKAIAMKQDYSVAKNSLGIVLMRRNKWDEALVRFKEVSEDLLYATPHYPLSNMGWVYLELGDHRTAELYFKKALEIKQEFIYAVHGLAVVQTKTGKIAAARRSWKQVIQLAPDTELAAKAAQQLDALSL